MKKINPLVTVIITAFNAEDFVKEALNSIIKQTYTNLEILIVDDASTDNTYQIIKHYSTIDKRIKIYKMKQNSGPSVASNFALQKAKGEYIARMDADDIAFPDRIEKQVNFLIKNPNVAIVGGQCVLIDKEGLIIGEKKYPQTHEEIYKSLYMINPIQHPTALFRKSIIDANKIIYHNHSLLAHDLELVFEISQYGKLANLPDLVLYYRQHSNSLSLKNPKETFKATVEVRKKAVKKYGYSPTIKGLIVHYCQLILVSLLPNKLIYSLFKFLRIKKNQIGKISSLARLSLSKSAYRFISFLL